MMDLPKITIVTPSFNQGQYIEETILSVINHDYPNLEYFVFDGGSTDQTVEVLERYSDKITYWESKKDKGQTEAINKGFKKATGEIITWINSDDILVKGSLIKVANHFKNDPELICLFGQWQEFDESGNRNFNHRENRNICDWMHKSQFSQPSTYYKTEIFESIGYLDESFQFSMDNDFFTQIVLFGFKTKYTNDIYSKFRWHDESKSSNLNEIARKDDAFIYQTILRSVTGCDALRIELAEFCEQHGVFSNDREKKYQINVQISEEDLRLSFTEFIKFYIGRWYNEGKFRKVGDAFSLLEKIGTLETIRKSNISKVYIRYKYLPLWLITTLRRFR